MRALSLRQPRAEQVIHGEKTLDIRTWQVAYRGPLAIHASSTRRPGRIRELGFDPDALVYGAVIGIVELVDIVPLDEAAYEATRPEHLSDAPFPGEPCYAWRFAHPRRLPQPVPYRGRMSLFHVPDELLAEVEVSVASAGAAVSPPVFTDRSRVQVSRRYTTAMPGFPATPPDPEHPFVLYTLPEADGGYRVVLYQWIQGQENGNGSEASTGEEAGPTPLWHIELSDDTLRAVTEPLVRALQTNGYRATDLSRRLRAPFFLDEPSGLRLALVFLAVKPVTRYDRIEAIVDGIRAMSDEEAYYWFSKCSAGPSATRAQKALRVLLANE